MRPGRNAAVPPAQVVIAVLLIVALLPAGAVIVAPLAFSLLAIALLWPVQRRLQTFLPRYIALLVSFAILVLVVIVFGWIVAWALGQVGRWMITDAPRFQQRYQDTRQWLEEHGIDVNVLWSENIGSASVLRIVHAVTSRVNSTFSFLLVALTYLLLGVMEVEDFERRIMRIRNPAARKLLLNGSRETALKLRRYMVIRTIMSFVTGVAVWLFTSAFGLPLAKEWGVIAFALNYIPFVGPLVATLLPAAFAFVHFDLWQSAVAILLGLNVIQFAIGSNLEPRVSGNALSLSPIVVLFSVFAWGYLWGIFGAFIGVPISIALMTFCHHHPSSQWLSELFGGDKTAHDKNSST